ncbi:TPA: AAA family ATPase [Yersinia enterocolitica]|jgi:ABC-type cobalamin/Fe3+-siderophores transport system ATPase subunit|nr:AAA family ATPase [Yersinia enterocolitica]HDL6614981.1 AAA family ATPase [Yersinia enterocolitica]
MAAYKKLEVKIKDVKAINELSLSVDLKPGLICLVGGNGSGKSTILNTISQLVDQSNINKLFFDEKRQTSSLSIKLGNEECTWTQVSGKWVKKGGLTELKGFHEPGIIYGSRFVNSSLHVINKYCSHYVSFLEENLVDAPDFVFKNLGKILKGNDHHYRGLKTITKADLIRQAKGIPKEAETFLIRMERPFLLKKDSGFITQYKMSSGEYLLLKILDYIYYRITYTTDKTPNKEPFLIIIDEVEIALHPSSQKRFIQFCNKVSKDHGICIIFSTHSRDIISNLRQDQIFLLESHVSSGRVSVTTPCYPHYAIRGIYESSGYDYIVCVEDELAKKIVSETIQKNELSKNKLVNVSALGGWREVLSFTHEFKINGLFNNTKMVIVLDGDMEAQFHKENGSPCRGCDYHNFIKDNEGQVKECGLNIPKLDCHIVRDSYPYYQDVIFLPISSLEKEVRNKLVINTDYDFISSLENLNYFSNSSISELISQYEAKAGDYLASEKFQRKSLPPSLIHYDADGKILWKLLTSNMRENVLVNDLVSYLCEIFPSSDERLTDTWNLFEKQLGILLQKPL